MQFADHFIVQAVASLFVMVMCCPVADLSTFEIKNAICATVKVGFTVKPPRVLKAKSLARALASTNEPLSNCFAARRRACSSTTAFGSWRTQDSGPPSYMWQRHVINARHSNVQSCCIPLYKLPLQPSRSQEHMILGYPRPHNEKDSEVCV